MSRRKQMIYQTNDVFLWNWLKRIFCISRIVLVWESGEDVTPESCFGNFNMVSKDGLGGGTCISQKVLAWKGGLQRRRNISICPSSQVIDIKK